MIVTLLLAFLAICSSHPAIYSDLELPPLDGTAPTVLSWHVHLVFSTYPEDVKEALAIRSIAREHFAEYLGEDCPDRFDDGRLCMIIDHDFSTMLIGGPFPAGEWSIFVPVPYYNLVVPWMTLHRGRFSLLVHPNTGYEMSDHDEWAMWSGTPWPLVLNESILGKRGEQSNEHGQYLGTPENIACVAEGTICGKNQTEVLCCSELACMCRSSNCKCQKPMFK